MRMHSVLSLIGNHCNKPQHLSSNSLSTSLSTLAPSSSSADNTTSCSSQAIPSSNMKKSLSPCEKNVISFGWGDFPLLGNFLYSSSHHDASAQQLATPCHHCASPDCSAAAATDTLPNIVEIDDSEDESVDTSDDDSYRRKASHSRRVQFSNIQVREHSVTLGNHPLSNSYPLSLDWEHADVQETTVDAYETKKMQARYPTKRISFRRHKPRRLTPLERRMRLEEVTQVSITTLTDQERQRRFAVQRERIMDARLESEHSVAAYV